MIKSKKTTKNIGGFTIVELLIATAVFSTVLLLSLTGFLQIGQLFYKGISATQTSAVARSVFESLKSDIVYDSSTTAISIQNSSAAASGVSRSYFCVGTNRYTFIPLQELDASKEATMMNNPGAVLSWQDFALLKDAVPVNTSCPDPFPPGGGPNQMGSHSKPVELLSDKSRVLNDTTQPIISPLATSSGKLYNLDVRIAYGDDTVLTNPIGPNSLCTGSGADTQYCFTTELNTTVRRGF